MKADWGKFSMKNWVAIQSLFPPLQRKDIRHFLSAAAVCFYGQSSGGEMSYANNLKHFKTISYIYQSPSTVTASHSHGIKAIFILILQH